jgi:hypothetical protein
MRPTIAKLRKTLPAFLTLEEYCALRNRCRASAFNDMRRVRGLGVKIGPHTRIVRDVALDEMARAQAPLPWLPQKDRRSAAAKVAVANKRSLRIKEPAAPQHERPAEVRP